MLPHAACAAARSCSIHSAMEQAADSLELPASAVEYVESVRHGVEQRLALKTAICRHSCCLFDSASNKRVRMAARFEAVGADQAHHAWTARVRGTNRRAAPRRSIPCLTTTHGVPVHFMGPERMVSALRGQSAVASPASALRFGPLRRQRGSLDWWVGWAARLLGTVGLTISRLAR